MKFISFSIHTVQVGITQEKWTYPGYFSATKETADGKIATRYLLPEGPWRPWKWAEYGKIKINTQHRLIFCFGNGTN